MVRRGHGEPMKLSTVILPIYRWPEAKRIWQRAEQLGFHAGYTYDHLTWRSFVDSPWFGAIPTLTAAATATATMRVGTLVASPNFRHPVPFAKELMTLDDISSGRLTLGIGAGGTGFDAQALGQRPWTPSERADHLRDFVAVLDATLRQPETSMTTEHYAAVDARALPGCVQQPRVPFYVAATGLRGLALAAKYADGWITYGDARDPAAPTPQEAPHVVAGQLARLEEACEREGRQVPHRLYLEGSSSEKPLESVGKFVDWAGRYAEIGITELVVHRPVPDSVYSADQAIFEQIATDGLSQLDH